MSAIINDIDLQSLGLPDEGKPTDHLLKQGRSRLHYEEGVSYELC